MKALAIILAAILLLFGLLAGGCAMLMFDENLNSGIEGFGLVLLVIGLVSLVVAIAWITTAVLIFRKATRKPSESPPELPRDDAPQL